MVASRVRWLLVGLVLVCGPQAYGRDHRPASGSESGGIEPPLQQPVLGLGLAPVSFPISGFDSDSQAYFNQGISALHGFWIFEAERNFREVIRRNPEHPLGYAFAAFAQTVFSSGDRARGLDYMTTARERQQNGKASLSQTETLWLDAIGAHFDKAQRDAKARENAHVDRLREALAAATDADVGRETNAFLSLAIWDYQISGQKKDDPKIVALKEEAERRLDEILKERPGHPVHHYKVHLFNDGANEARARESARQTGPTNPACAHQWHMASHIYSALKEYRLAAYQFEAAHRVDNRYLAAHGLDAHVVHNYAHNVGFMLETLMACGGVDRALVIGRDLLGGPRAFNAASAYNDPVDSAAEGLVELLEEHQLWEEVDKLNAEGYFAGLFTRRADSLKRAKLLRLLGLSMLERGDRARAEEFLAQLKAAGQERSGRRGRGGNRKALENLALDLEDWLAVYATKDKPTLAPETLDRLLKRGTTPKHRLALLAWEAGDLARAETIAREAVAKKPSQAAPSAVLAFILAAQGKADDAGATWESTKQTVHIPMNGEITADRSSIRGAFPFLERVEQEFVSKGLVAADRVNDFYEVAGGAQPSLIGWEQANRPMQELGPLTLSLPQMPIALESSSLLDQAPRLTPRLQNMLRQGFAAHDLLLVVFRMGPDCPACNREQEKLVSEHLQSLRDRGVELLLVHPGQEELEAPEGVSTLKDPGLNLFRAFGVFDEFTNQPAHGVFLVAPGGVIRWNARSRHIFENWRGLLDEISRQQGVKLQEPNAAPLAARQP